MLRVTHRSQRLGEAQGQNMQIYSSAVQERMLILQKNTLLRRVLTTSPPCKPQRMLLLHKQPCLLPPWVLSLRGTFWWLLNWSAVFRLGRKSTTITYMVGPTTKCVQSFIKHWDFAKLHHMCQCVCEVPCSSGDLPAASSLVVSSGTQRLCSSRVSTDRHRQSTRQPLEGTEQQTAGCLSITSF